MQLREGLRQRQAKSRPFVFAVEMTFDLVEGGEDLLDVVRVNADPAVRNSDRQAAAFSDFTEP